jgi:hypothetical protein
MGKEWSKDGMHDEAKYVLKGQQTKILVSFLVSNDGGGGLWSRAALATADPELVWQFFCAWVLGWIMFDWAEFRVNVFLLNGNSRPKLGY